MEEKDSSVQAIVAAIKDAVRKSVASPYTSEDIPLALHEPCFQGNENAYVKECIDTGWGSCCLHRRAACRRCFKRNGGTSYGASSRWCKGGR